MPSSHRIGRYYDLKARRWYEGHGYDVHRLDIGGRRNPQDPMGCDFAAIGPDGLHLVQCKGGKTNQLARAKRQILEAADWPEERVFHLVALWWPRGASEPILERAA